MSFKKYQYYIPKIIREPLKIYLKELLVNIYFIRCIINRIFFINKLEKTKTFLHLGCGDLHIDNCINLDYRATKATDLIHDCNNLSLFGDKTFTAVYSHAFFEHLYRVQRLPLLKDIRRVLKDDGYAMFLGIPDFERIATAYINKEKGLFSETFDIFEVYRYTHGDPERYPSWWLQQLHKSLFDATELASLLSQAGFNSYIIFRYCFRSENLPVSLGFYATLTENKNITLKNLILVIDKFTNSVNKKTISILKIK
jgi:SAM-dependent methyltransferase